MSAAVQVAVPELRRMAPDALRMVGLSLGQADQTAEMVAWTEATTGGALRFLRIHRERLLWIPRPRAAVTRPRSQEAVLETRGGSLLELGIRAFDFICAEASLVGNSRVVIKDTFGAVFLPYLVWRANKRGYAVTVQDSNDESNILSARDGMGQKFNLICEAEIITAPSCALPSNVKLAEKFQVSLDEGIWISGDDFNSFVELFEMLRVPTSERSRTHAG